jgi:RimJ/RimL family protein N-acetyltransferase
MPERRLAHVCLAGERALLRPHRPEDDQPAFALLSGQDEILRWLVWDGPASPADLREHYSTWRLEAEQGCDYRLAIVERKSSQLAGSITVRFLGHPGSGDVGYWLGLPYWGRGLASEAMVLLARLSFQHLLADSLYAWVFVGNHASRRLLERTGFSLVRTVPGRVVKRGRRVDEWHFTLLRSEWRRCSSGFRPSLEELSWEERPPRDPLDSPAGLLPGG